MEDDLLFLAENLPAGVVYPIHRARENTTLCASFQLVDGVVNNPALYFGGFSPVIHTIHIPKGEPARPVVRVVLVLRLPWGIGNHRKTSSHYLSVGCPKRMKEGPGKIRRKVIGSERLALDQNVNAPLRLLKTHSR